MPRFLFCACAALVVTVLAPVGPAWAQDESTPKSSASRREAKRLFDRGRIAFRAKRYEEAILRWQESYAISNEPLILWNIANAFEALEQPAEALAYLHEWAPHAKDDEKAELEERIARLEQDVESLPPEPAPDDVEPSTPDVDVPEPEQDRGTPAMEIAGWTMVGIGGAAVVTGVVLDLVAASARPDADALCRDLDGDLLCEAEARDDITSSNTLAIAGDVTWIAGGVVAATGLALALVSRLGTPESSSDDTSDEARSVNAQPRIGLTPGGGWHLGLGVDGSF